MRLRSPLERLACSAFEQKPDQRTFPHLLFSENPRNHYPSGGLTDEGLVPRVFYPQGDQTVQQLSLFDAPSIPYEAGEAKAADLD